MRRNDLYPIVEIFESFQGEGPWMGRRALFIRFAGCNLVGKCFECDTDFRVRRMMTLDEIYEKLKEYFKNYGWYVVFTGGEPSIYQEQILRLFEMKDLGGIGSYAIETNGIIRLNDEIMSWLDLVIVSPKKGFEEFAYKNYANSFWRSNMTGWKFVVGDVPKGSRFWSFDEVREQVNILFEKYKVSKRRIWLMPYGANIQEIKENAKKVWKLALELGVNYSDRLHIRIWNESKMGV